MSYNRHYPLSRAILNGVVILGLVIATGASALTAYAAPMTNNLISNAIAITTAGYTGIVDDVVPATTSVSDPVISCGASKGMDSVWYTFVPLSSGLVSINTLNSQYDTILAVYHNDPLVPGALVELGCNDNSGGSITSAISMALRGGIRYYIEVVRKTGTAVSSPDRLVINYSFANKVVAWGDPLGKKWDADDDSLFTYTGGWTTFPLDGAYRGNIKISNNVNGTATTYFDGGSFDLHYALGPTMGTLSVYVDNVFQVNLGQGAANYVPGMVWNSPMYSDGVHKLTLRHTVGSTQVNFDHIVVYSFPDVIPPDRILTLAASVGATTGKITLKWKAVGDDGMVGTATKYELRYFPDTGVPIGCIADWATGTPYITGLPTPTIAGSTQQVTLAGFVPGLKYFFCLAAVDEVGNMGIPSNRVGATPTASVLYGTGTYDDRHPGWTYTGNWTLVNNPDARYNTLHISNKINDTAVFSFTGTQFVFTYLTGPASGLMDVYIDGVYVTTIDQYTFYPNSFYYTSPILAKGPHVVRFVHMTQVQVTVDQIYVWSTADGGPPDPITDLVAVPGVNDGEVDLTWTATGDDPGGVGKAKLYEIRYSNTPINNAVEWDYAMPAAGVFPAPQVAGAAEAMTVIGLTPAAHYYFAVRASDNAYYNILSNTTDSDVTYTGLFAPAGFAYDDAHAIWNYNGTWTTVLNASASAGHFHRINLFYPGSSARFWFNGTSFALRYHAAPGYGRVNIYVDGTLVTFINQYFAVQDFKVWNWLTAGLPPLAAGNHVVEIVPLDTKATVDTIRIFP